MKRSKDMKDFIAALLLTAFFGPLYGNSPIIIREALAWSESPVMRTLGEERYQQWNFSGAVISDEQPALPYFIRRFPVDGNGRLRVEVISAGFEPFDRRESTGDDQIGASLRFETSVESAGHRYYGKIAFVPIVRRGGGFERVTEFELRITHEPLPAATRRSPDNTRESVLRNGSIYKIAVNEDGLHKLSYDFLRDELGVDVDNIDPQRIQLFGNGGGILPRNVDTPRPDDLTENHILVAGEADGRFDDGDYILFYAQGPDQWRYDEENQIFNLQKNIYSTRNFYFLKIGSEPGKRLQEQSSLTGTAVTTSSFDDFQRFEEEQVNLLHEWRPLAQGSGPRWYGDHFKNQREYRYPALFEFPNLEEAEPVTATIEMALRATDNSRFTADIGGQTFNSDLAPRVPALSGSFANERNYASQTRLQTSLNLQSPSVDVIIRYPHPGGGGDGSEGWLDYIQFNVRRRLILTGAQMVFRDTRTMGVPSASFQLSGAGPQTAVWDITDPLRPKLQQVNRSAGQLSFGTQTGQLRTFIAFQTDADFPAPEAAGAVANQNLHGIDQVDMVILTHPDFEGEARTLAEHRRRFSNLEVEVVRIDLLYHEFSSGKQDPTAIRDFARMLYQRSPRFRYLLLFGDGSFDARDIYGLGTNFIPVYETDSFNPIFSFPSDDYYALLDDGSSNPLSGGLDIAVGRIPAQTPEEAGGIVRKIINYDTNPQSLGDWRNRILFIGDDEDGMQHTQQAEQIADSLARRYDYLNIDKVYIDAFPQVATPGGTRFPAATEAINQAVFKGTLAITYLGHGGSGGLAEERILEIPDLLNWRNFNQPPLLVTATCSFAGYDDPAFTTAGEEAIMNERGGAIALLTTVRAVFSSFNKVLTEQAMKTLFERPDGQVQTIGEVMIRAKNRLTSVGVLTNSRKFTLLGDPAMKIAQPAFNVQTTRINSRPVNSGRLDTLGALQRVTIEGQILDRQGQLFEGFNGIIAPTIFDKKLRPQTLGQDDGSFPFEYDLQKNVIFKGRATVSKGRFQFTFVIPKDINYQLGRGKVSYYASDQQTLIDATGAYEDIFIGGTNTGGAVDNQGPQVEVFMNSEDFAFGSITGESPTLLVLLEDDNGINVVGNSIGHDLEATLDDDTQNTILLNDFYESELDDYRRGAVRYPLAELSEGRHTIRVKAWDVANNSSEGYTEFVVASSGEIALQHVLNYPNPFSDFTCFQFDHNLANQEIEVMVQIFTISGRLIKTLEKTIFSDGAIRRDNCIEWDGRDDYGDPLARGVYLYKVKVRATNTGNTELQGESEFEKLVLLK